MLEFIQNPWVIGIVGGIVCGIIVWLLTRCAISSKGNNEYIKKIYQANDEVFLSLKRRCRVFNTSRLLPLHRGARRRDFGPSPVRR